MEQSESPDPAAASRESELWSRLTHEVDASSYVESWLALLCREQAQIRRGAVLLGPPDRGPFTLAASWPEDQRPGRELLETAEAALTKRDDVVVESSSGDGLRLHDSGHVSHALVSDGRLFGAVVLELSPTTELDPESALRRLKWAAGWLDSLLQREQARTERDSKARYETVLTLLAAQLDHERFQGAATAFATELATLLHCDRVGVGFLQRGQLRLRALSHNANFDRKTNLARAIEGAMTEALDQDSTVVFPAPEESAATQLAHADLSHRYGSHTICTVPFAIGETACGAMTLERSSPEPFDRQTVELCEAAASLAGPVLEIQRRDDRWLLGRAGDATRAWLANLVGPDHVVLKLVTTAVTALLLFMAFATGEYRVTADTLLEPSVLRAAVAPFDGYIARAEVRPGDIVAEGDALGALDDRDLQLERAKWTSERAQSAKQFRQAMAERDAAQVEILSAAMQEADAELDRIEALLSRTALTAPFAGVVVTGDLDQMLGAPVSRGDVLFEVAPLDSYRVILQVDESDIADVELGQTGQMILTSFPHEPLELTVVKITPVSVAEEGQNFFRVEAELTSAPDDLRPGLEGIGKIGVDSRRLLWIWTHDVIDWLRLAAWSWLP